MQAIIDVQGSLAKPLVQVDIRNDTSQVEDVLSQTLDNLYSIFKKCNMVHGDFSANNILYDGEQIYIIDVSQAGYVNFNTFTDTPKKIRFDKALDILFRDLLGILSFFEKRFRVTLERKLILSQFVDLIPDNFQSKVEFILSKYQSLHGENVSLQIIRIFNESPTFY